MRTWKITGILAVLIIGFLLISGCTQDNSKYCTDNFPGTYYNPSSKMCEHTPEPTPVPTPTITPPISTMTPVSTTIQEENIDSIRAKLNSEWSQIQDVYDEFTINKRKVDNNDFRARTVPNTISEYEKIKNDLLNININNSDLQAERTVLISICDYKIKDLQAMSSLSHAAQTKTFNLQTSLEEYTNAKYFLQDELDIINEIPYSKKYWDYIYNDKQSAQQNLQSTKENILILS
jgi:hypothetical protein